MTSSKSVGTVKSLLHCWIARDVECRVGVRSTKYSDGGRKL